VVPIIPLLLKAWPKKGKAESFAWMMDHMEQIFRELTQTEQIGEVLALGHSITYRTPRKIPLFRNPHWHVEFIAEESPQIEC
jgi:hypothetical protein